MTHFPGNPKPVITWSKDGKEIKDDARFAVKCEGDKATLTVKDATEADSGTYKATAKSAAGEVTTDVQVKVEAKQVKPS